MVVGTVALVFVTTAIAPLFNNNATAATMPFPRRVPAMIRCVYAVP